MFILLTVNNRSLLRCTHDEAVGELRQAGDEIILTVRHYKAATPFLNKTDGNYILFTLHYLQAVLSFFLLSLKFSFSISLSFSFFTCVTSGLYFLGIVYTH